jgi:glutamyl-tRNA synthetase
MSKVRVRFAPSPTGALHIGGIRTALYNYLLAKKLGGTFILRIEDTDQGRFVPGAEDYIVESLKWCGIKPDEGTEFGGNYGPYRQSERKELYHIEIQKLLASGNAYYAFDTSEEIESMRTNLTAQGIHDTQYGIKTRMTMRNALTLSHDATTELLKNNTPYVIRLKLDTKQKIEIDDIIRGKVTFMSDELDDKVLMKSDGLPTYHLANIVDDHYMEISHVIRGEEWLPSTAHHVLLYKAFGWEAPIFAHLPLILKPDGKGKLSKRDGVKLGIPVFPISWKGATPEESFVGFREYGFEPEAMINFMALLGWSPSGDQELFSLENLIAEFSIDKINKSGARFDFDKAKWFNQQYILHMADDKYIKAIENALTNTFWTENRPYFESICLLLRARLTFAKDFNEQAYYFFGAITSYDIPNVTKRWKKENRSQLEQIMEIVRNDINSTPEALEHSAKELIQNNNWKMGDLFPILRIALSGSMQGPGIFEIISVLGKEKSITRIEASLDYFDTIID